MKRIILLLISFSIIFASSCNIGTAVLEPKETSEAESTSESFDNNDMKAIWISQYDLDDILISNGVQADQNDFESKFKIMINNIKDCGFDSVIVQLRPFGDSIYPSKVYPPSYLAVGSYGNAFVYDPLEIMIGTAHESGIAVHAWINPLRCMKTSEISKVSSEYKIRQWYDSESQNISIFNNRIYINPAFKDARKLICDGISEIIENYDIDGIHMDDYFYPTTDLSFDNEVFSTLEEFSDISEFRRNNISQLVKEIYNAKSVKNIPFGISPAGNINTVYSEDMADIYLWCSESGYIDYIAPQIYFGLKHQNWDFIKTANIWNGIIKCDSVKLIIGMTLGKVISKEDAYAGSGKYEWLTDKEILKRCLEATKDIKNCKGICIFTYSYLFNPISGEKNEITLEEAEAFCKALDTMEWN